VATTEVIASSPSHGHHHRSHAHERTPH
jgi:hypothetical protein